LWLTDNIVGQPYFFVLLTLIFGVIAGKTTITQRGKWQLSTATCASLLN